MGSPTLLFKVNEGVFFLEVDMAVAILRKYAFELMDSDELVKVSNKKTHLAQIKLSKTTVNSFIDCGKLIKDLSKLYNQRN